MADILVVGLAVIDFLFDVTEMPSQAQKYIAHDACMVGGGGAANAAVTIARLGGNARLAARVGGDMFGEIIVDDLLKESVDCSLVQRTDAARSSFSSVLVDATGERQIVNYRGNNLSDDTQALENVTVDAVLADTRWQAGTLAAMKLAQRLGVPAVLDGEAPLLPEALPLATHVAFSKQGLGALSDKKHPADALFEVSGRFSNFVCVTDGENGVYFMDKGKVEHIPAAVVDVVDTLGAGDVWHGAFALSLANGSVEGDAIVYANAAASLKCMRAGGGRAGPTATEVAAFMKRPD